MINPDHIGRDDAGLLARRRMIFDDIYRRGIRDERVLQAMEDVPRERFLPPELQDAAFEDRALPIGAGQTISQPYIVAYMTEQLDVTPQSRVLEIGTGSGYQTAILARLAREVYTLERIDRLSESASRRLEALGVANVRFRCGDGTLGWPDAAPFDRILVTAAGPKVPPALLNQLDDGGILIAPIGDEPDQRLVKVHRHGPSLIETPLIAVRFVRLIGESGWKA